MHAANLVLILAWAAIAVAVTVRLSKRGAATFDDRFSPADQRLTGVTALYLGAPAVSLIAHGAQLGLAHVLGAEARFETWIYWSGLEVSAPDRRLEALVAAAGPITRLALAAALIVWTRALPSRAAINHLRLETARVLLVLAFAVEPLVSLLAESGDVWALREALNAVHAQSGDAALLGYGVVAAFSLWRWRRARRLRVLATPLHDAKRRARAGVDADPDDPEARLRLGAALLASGDPQAVGALEAAREHGADARVELLLGRAYLEQGRASEAAACLRHAGATLEESGDRPDLLLEVTLALGAARIAEGDAEGAILTAAAARDAAPRDPRALIMLADALVLGGRIDEARGRLEDALAQASGAVRAEIQRRLAALR